VRRRSWEDEHGVTRVGRVEDLPDESIQCYARGHRFDDDGPALAVTGWGPVNAAEIRSSCDCGRRRREVLDADTGERLTSSDYTGSVMLAPGSDFPKAAARLEWLRRRREAAAGATPVRSKRRRRKTS
jgi:hypothetical protein